ncbi:hypothetical protein SAMN05444280_10987 [Tangfeifania diversioriginum]|uniref:Calx-beta domain-containing protein n=1 Tax=Tangfeifania diversioriginum TaxID=1168035 RepID=A0A1M6FUW7_9BACT|nr:hypothetical protein [Tangfeifania diversioriginum]SHJ01453.1 hypothetical protein SAMN05444280_10987 [Tangfeifania diversioriginum]
MKINKLLIAISVLVALAVAACSEFEDTVEPSPAVPDGCQGVYFPASNTSAYELEPTEPTQITITIAREVSSGAVEVPVNVEVNDEDVYNVPSSISFADGETEVDFTVTFPDAGEGTTYNLKLAVEGDEYVNPYASALPYVTTSVTRIKWAAVEEPMVYVDGTVAYFYGVEALPMYVNAEKAEVTGMTRYRFKNAYRVAPTGEWVGEEYEAIPDEDGIYDGFPYNYPGDFDENNDYYTIIEIDNATGEVFMYAHELGMAWGDGMFSIGSVYNNLSDDKASYPLGTIVDGVITFPSNSLFVSEAEYNDGGKYPASVPTYIYLTKDAFIAANLKIDDFNDVEYEAIAGEVGEFESAAYSDNWSQTLSMAIDIDPENEESEYKNLYYLSNLYAEGYGVAFYYNEEEESVTIPENQSIGAEFMGKDIYVSPSDSIESSVVVNAKGVTIYTLGLIFHFEDGTIVGEFAETFFYSEDAVSYDKEDFLGDFVMSGLSQFGEADANMEINIAEGEDENSLVITGIDYAAEVIASFDPSTSIMSVTPQVLPDIVTESATYDATLYTTDAEGVSTTAVMDFTFNMQGNLVMTSTSQGDGYLINSEAAGGWLDGYYNLVFSPLQTKSAYINTQNFASFNVRSSANLIIKQDLGAGNNFEIQGKKAPKKFRKDRTQIDIVF